MELVELESVCDIKNGFAFKSAQYQTEGTPLLRISNFDNGNVFINNKTIYVDEKYLVEKSDFIVEKGDVLIALSGATTGKYGVYNEDYPSLLNQRIGLLKSGVSEKLDNNFFFFYLSILKKEILRKAGGAAQPNISTKTIGEFKIPLPPLATQQKIAAILDEADKLRQLNKELIAKYDALTQSLFLDMFGDPVTNPMGWKEAKMSEVCSKVTDGTHDTPKRLKQGIKFITGKHIRPYTIDYNNSDYVTDEIHRIIYRRCNPEKGDVLYTNIGVNLGTAALNIVDYEFSMKNVALLKPLSDLILGRYLEYFLNNESMKSKIVWMASLGGAQQFLSLTQLRRLKVNLPPIQLQNQFAERIALIEQQKQQATAALQKSEDLFNSLLQKAFKGELV
jgi:type I restriction enzyme S subunit